MVRSRSLSIAGVCLLALACNDAPAPPKAPPADDRVKALADAYLDGFFARNPDQITLLGVPGRRHDALPDNSLDALRLWQAREDGWLKALQQIDPAAINASSLRATQAILRETLEGAIG